MSFLDTIEEQESKKEEQEEEEQEKKERKSKAKQIEIRSKRRVDQGKQKEEVNEREEEKGEEEEKEEEEFEKEKEERTVKGKKKQPLKLAGKKRKKKEEQKEKEEEEDKEMRPPAKRGENSTTTSKQVASKATLKGQKTMHIPLKAVFSLNKAPLAKSISDNVPRDQPSQKGDSTSSHGASSLEKNVLSRETESSDTCIDPFLKDPADSPTDDVIQEREEVVMLPMDHELEPLIDYPIECPVIKPNKSLENVSIEEEEEDLLAGLEDLDKAISINFAVEDKGKGVPAVSNIASATPSSFANPNILTSLLCQVQEILTNPLEILAIDEALQKTLFELLQQLDTIEKPQALADQVTSLHNFYEGLCEKFPKAQSTIFSHQKLIDAKGKHEKDLVLYIKTKSILSSSVSKGKNHFDKISIEIQDLEHQLVEKKEKRDFLRHAIKKNEANLEKAKEKVSKCLQANEEIEKALPTSTKAAEDAEQVQNELRGQLSLLKKSFENYHP